MTNLALILLMAVALKSILIGSDFSIYKWIRDGKEYRDKYNDWYSNKP